MRTPAICIWLLGLVLAGTAVAAVPEKEGSAPRSTLEQWQAARFGLFVHWGPVALKGTEISWSRDGERRGYRPATSGMPAAVYDRLYTQFDPVRFDAREWVAIAQAAGTKYFVFTSRHHDGFSMFDTRADDYKITSPLSPFRRDIVGELAAACHSAGMKFGIYYSQPNWRNPDAFVPERNARYLDYLKTQIRELMTNYGRVDILWFDGLSKTAADYDGVGLNRLARQIQPNLLINNRDGSPEDFDTPEQRIGKYQDDRPWESCVTLCRQWAWKPNDEMKSLKQCVQTLVTCAGGDGNLLLNVGPMPDGRIEPRQVERLREIGAWLAHHGESVYGTRGGPWKPIPGLASTRKGRTVFVHLLGRESGPVELPALARTVRSAARLGGGQVKFRQQNGILELFPDPTTLDPVDTIVRLELDGSAMDLPAISLAAGAATTDFDGFHRLNFEVDGRACRLLPQTAAPGNPWIWRTEFFGQFAQADAALLRRGFHVAYMDVQNLYGAPVALEHMDRFYAYLLGRRHLAPKCVLEGLSRGGLFAFNWAARSPRKIASIYVDAPVCDFKSWPGGKGRGTGSPADWARLKQVYGFTEEQAMAYPLNPIDNLQTLADARIPILSVCGDADKTVPFDENTGRLAQRYRALGGEIQVILKPGAAHHPHSLPDPTPIVEFILSHEDTGGGPPLLPVPVQARYRPAPLDLRAGIDLVLPDAPSRRLVEIASILREGVADLLGNPPDGSVAPVEVRLVLTPGGGGDAAAAEAYLLRIGKDVTVEASDPRGLLWGVQTLIQSIELHGGVPTLQEGVIEDRPHSVWRALMLDPARTFLDVPFLRRTIRAMSACKLNVLHLHLIDDQAWRFPSLGYPRCNRSGEPFYTREELRGLVAFARRYGVEILPEFDVPGHAATALMAYPELDSQGRARPMREAILCIGKPAVWRFIADLVAESADVFPFEYIHLGADEPFAIRQWETSPDCQERMRQKGVTTVAALYQTMIADLDELARKHGKKLIVWNDAIEATIQPLPPKDVVIDAWADWSRLRGLAAAGYGIINSSNVPLYLSSISTHAGLPLETVEQWNPERFAAGAEKPGGMEVTYADWSPGARLLGGQASIWATEQGLAERRLYPRLFAVAETLWSGRCAAESFDARLRDGGLSAALLRLGIPHDPAPTEALRLKADSNGQWQYSAGRYRNFDLTFDEKSAAQPDFASLVVRCLAAAALPAGYEVRLEPKSGSAFSGQWRKGDWNRMELVARDAELTLSINGSLCWSMADSAPRGGLIALRRTDAEFRNVRVRPLD